MQRRNHSWNAPDIASCKQFHGMMILSVVLNHANEKHFGREVHFKLSIKMIAIETDYLINIGGKD